MEMLTSPANPRLKRVRALLQQGKRRREERAFILEGVRLIDDALQTGALPEFVLYRPDTHDHELLQRLQALQILCLPVEPKLFDDLGDTQTSQGILAVCPWPDLSVPEIPQLTLILDGIADPGNVGTILRAAVAAGVDLVIVSHSADPYNPKVVRAGMGAHFRMPIRSWTWEQIRQLKASFWAADMAGERTIYEVEWKLPLALVIGGEAHGLSSQAKEAVSQTVRIPMVSGESLNAAMAATVILYEIYRQRLG